MVLPQLRRVRWAVRATLVLGVAASVVANILHALDNPISQAIAAWPPLALLLTVELISRVPVHRRSLAFARLVATATIAGIAAWVSYWHMVGVAARYGETGASPYLLPLSVDGLIVVASICLVELGGRIATIEAERSTRPTSAIPQTPVPSTVPESAETPQHEAAIPGLVPTPGPRRSAPAGPPTTPRQLTAAALAEVAAALPKNPQTFTPAASRSTTAGMTVRSTGTGTGTGADTGRTSTGRTGTAAGHIGGGRMGAGPTGTGTGRTGAGRTGAGHTNAGRTGADRGADHTDAEHAGAGRTGAGGAGAGGAGAGGGPGGSRSGVAGAGAASAGRNAGKATAGGTGSSPRPRNAGVKVRRTPAETVTLAARIKAERPTLTDAELAAELGISISRWRTVRREAAQDRDLSLAA
ncbi:DUF2637 domain-containing protein [Wangella sp. NEAU-J3]|nr:DUF2637 domain-containing protein [Jidongwangia harbinensis]